MRVQLAECEKNDKYKKFLGGADEVHNGHVNLVVGGTEGVHNGPLEPRRLPHQLLFHKLDRSQVIYMSNFPYT